jgi:hypothetical protein
MKILGIPGEQICFSNKDRNSHGWTIMANGCLYLHSNVFQNKNVQPCYFQKKTKMFCLPIPTLMHLMHHLQIHF